MNTLKAPSQTLQQLKFPYNIVLLLFTFLLIAPITKAQPGETCTNPLIINSLPYETEDNTAAYQNDYIGTPGSSGCGIDFSFLTGSDVVYQYTSASETYININMTPGINWSGVFVYGSCDDIGTSCLAGASGLFAGERLIENFQISDGETIFIVISSAYGSMDYSFSVTDQTGKSCESAIEVPSLPYTTTDNSANYGSNFSGSVGSESSCGTDEEYLTGDNIIYAYTATETVMIDISLLPSATWTSIFVYSDCANIGVSCMAIGDYGLPASERRIDDIIIQQGETIYIMITRGFTESFAYTLNITEQQGIICESAIPVPSLPYTTTDNTTNYGIYYPGTPGNEESCGSSEPHLIGENVVYSYTATAGTLLNILLTDNNPFSSIFVYDDCANIGVTCYTEGSFGVSLTENVIEDLFVNSGQTIYIIISSVNGMDYTLNITESVGEVCEASIPFNTLPFTDTNNTVNFGSSYSGPPGGCGTTENYLSGDNAFYKYTATSDNLIDISLDSEAPGSALFLYIGCVNVGTYCTEGAYGLGSGERVIEDYFIEAGYVVYILVTNISGSMDYTLSVTANETCPPGTETEGEIVGMPCIKPGFINTFVSSDCECVGDIAPPAPPNDLLENATPLILNSMGNCPENSIAGDNTNATPGYSDAFCDSDYPDIFYTFNSGNNNVVQLNLLMGTMTGKTISYGVVGEENYPCSYQWGNSSNNLEVVANTNYFIRIGAFDANESIGTFLICLSAGNPDIFDCPELTANFGDPCDDGFANTTNDIVQPSCNCLGEINTIPENNFQYSAQQLPLNAIGDCPDNAVFGDNSMATAEFTGPGCETDSPDVYYIFNSGDNTSINLSILPGSIENQVISFGPLNGTLDCSYTWGNHYSNRTVIPNTDYIIRIATFLGSGPAGSFMTCLSAENPQPITEASLNGTVNWNSSCGNRAATIILYQPGSSMLIAEYETTLDANGNFLVSDIATGTYDIFIKVNGYLQKGVESFLIANGSNPFVPGTIINGDIDGNNAVNINDLTAIISSFGLTSTDAGFNILADLNCDGNININDLTALMPSFGISGDAAPLN